MWSWQPPADPDKPDCPYLPGFEVDIETHTPPPPFGSSDYPRLPQRERVSDEWLYSVTQTQHILRYQPIETPPPAQRKTARLTVTKSLAIGNARGAQLLLCLVAPQEEDFSAKPFTAVAKLYDPLYYSFVSAYGCHPENTTRGADSHYSREAASYECLSKANLAGPDLFAPAYFGSWTFSLPITYHQQTHQRRVRLILMEHIDGVCMFNLFVPNGPVHGTVSALHLSQEYRLQVLAMLLDGVVKQHHAGVDQHDLAPRNVMIVPPPNQAQERPQRVVLVDYNVAIVWEKTKYGKLPAQLAKLPPNPMGRFWDSGLIPFECWNPAEWFMNSRPFQEWLRHEFGGDKMALYEPINEELELHESEVYMSQQADEDEDERGDAAS